MYDFNLDTSLITFPCNEGISSFKIRDAVEGVQIFGGIGSGKTSGSGRMFALKYLSHGFGGLVLTAKPDEKEMWEEYCRLTNRIDDLVILEPGGAHRFNFLEYESSVTSENALTSNLVQVLKTVIRASENKSEGKSDDQFWETSLDMLIHNVIDLCQMANGKVSVQQMYDIITTAPKKGEEGNRANPASQSKTAYFKAFETSQKKITDQIEIWAKTFTEEEKARFDDSDVFDIALVNRFPEARLLKSIDQFFNVNYRNLSEKTRSIIEFIFSGFLFHLMKEPVYSLFCRGKSTVVPEDCIDGGKIILINLPVKLYHKVGRDCQILFKYIWQRAMERRQIKLNDRPLFLWSDEAQNFLHEYDAEYQATARSSRIATVYISQNLPNYYANMGGAKSEYRVKSFLGTLGTKVFHANADIDTNMYASDLIGEAYAADHSRSTNVSGDFSISSGVSYKLEKMVRPENFGLLRNGGPLKSFKVDGYVHRQGQTFPNGFNHEMITFNQLYY